MEKRAEEEEEEEAEEAAFGSESSSSIGHNSDDDDDDEDEVQSTLSSLASLEDSLPIKKGGLSKFYGGKSKSYGNVGDARTVNDLGKPDNPFNKRRRTLIAYNLIFNNSNNNNIGVNPNSNPINNKTKNRSALFYAHSNHISMPLLPLAEDDDDNDHCNVNGVVLDHSSDDTYAPNSQPYYPTPPPSSSSSLTNHHSTAVNAAAAAAACISSISDHKHSHGSNTRLDN